MAAIKCTGCGRNYSSSMTSCPYCKQPNTSSNEDQVAVQPTPVKATAPIKTRTPSKKQPSSPANKDIADLMDGIIPEIPADNSTNDKSVDNAKPKIDEETMKRLKQIEEENKKLRAELEKEKSETNKQKSEETPTKTEHHNSPKATETTTTQDDADDSLYHDEKEDAFDENFDRILNPEKYSNKSTKSQNKVMNKLSGTGNKIASVIETSKAHTAPGLKEEFDDDNENEIEEFDEEPVRKIATSSKKSSQKYKPALEEPVTDEYDDVINDIEDNPEDYEIIDYDANADHYYDDVLPELLAEKDRIPKETIIRIGITVASCAIALLVAAYRLV